MLTYTMKEHEAATWSVSPVDFRRKIDGYDGESIREQIGNVVDDVWAAPGYREHQRETVVDIVEKLYIEDCDVVLLQCPTGGGKSIVIDAVTGVVDAVLGRKSFSTTPLNALVDQIEDDEFLDDVITVKGRNNYTCVHPQDRGTSVDSAICQRDDSFECEYKHRPHTAGGCPYYGRKMVAQNRSKVVTNLSFLMANAMIPDVADAGFDPREMLAVDECQGVDDFALLFVGVTVSERSVPIDFEGLSFPSSGADQRDVIEWLETDVMYRVTSTIEQLESEKDGLTFGQKQQDQLEDLRRFTQKVTNFIADAQDHEWAMTIDTDGATRSIEFEPIHVGRFMDNYLWSQSNKVLCASATIPPNFVEEVGLDDRSVARIEVPSTFPPERRPVITTESVGKMTQSERDTTLPKMADQIGRIADIWDGHAGIVHCNSYRIAERLYDRLPHDVTQRTRLQDGDDREQSLQDWIDAPVDETGSYRYVGGQLFLSVAMAEGISLDDAQARFNIVAKASYPFLGDERVSYRINELNDWNWYSSQAAIDLQQAAGRTTRSREDWSATYVLDDSAVQLIERNDHLFENWFLDAVDCDFDEDVVAPDTSGVESDQPERSDPPERSDADPPVRQSSLDDIADEYFG